MMTTQAAAINVIREYTRQGRAHDLELLIKEEEFLASGQPQDDTEFPETPATPSIKTAEVSQGYIKSLRSYLKPDTLKGYEKELNRFSRSLETVPTRPEQIEGYMEKGLKGQELSPARRAYLYSVLKGLYQYITNRIDPNFPQVMNAIRVPKVDHKATSGYLTLDELRQVFEVANDRRDIAMLNLGAGQGLRPCTEMVRINVGDVLDDRIYIRGKERPEWLPLLSEIHDSLLLLADGKGEGEPLFISQWKRRLSADMAYLRLKALLGKAGIRGPNKQHPYVLRHTFYTLMRAAGCDKASVDALMRHRTQDVSVYYDHLSDEDKLQLLKAKLEQYSPLRQLNKNYNKSDMPQNFFGSLRLG